MIINAWECIGGGPLNNTFVTFSEYYGTPLAVVATDACEVGFYEEHALAKQAPIYVYRFSPTRQKFVLEGRKE